MIESTRHGGTTISTGAGQPAQTPGGQLPFLPGLLAACLMIGHLSCGGITPMDPTGIAVWADDCSEIACAINKYDWDGRTFMNHETNQRYELAVFDENGARTRTVRSEQKSDGYESTVENLYFMKSKGYFLLEIMRLNCGGRVFDMVGLDGKTTRLHHVACESAVTNIDMAPSTDGTFIALVSFEWSAQKTTCNVTFFDSTGKNEIKKIDPFESSISYVSRWLSDSVLAIINPYGAQGGLIRKMGPFLAARDTAGSNCSSPQTSSSSYCPGKGSARFDGKNQTIVINPTVPAASAWCPP